MLTNPIYAPEAPSQGSGSSLAVHKMVCIAHLFVSLLEELYKRPFVISLELKMLEPSFLQQTIDIK